MVGVRVRVRARIRLKVRVVPHASQEVKRSELVAADHYFQRALNDRKCV